MPSMENILKRERFHPCILDGLAKREVSKGEKQVSPDYCTSEFNMLIPAIVLTASFSYIINAVADLYLAK